MQEEQPLDLAAGHQPEPERMSVDRPPLDEHIDRMLNERRAEVEREQPASNATEAERVLQRQICAQQELRPNVPQVVQGANQPSVSGSAMQRAAAALPQVPAGCGRLPMRPAVRQAMEAVSGLAHADNPPAQVPVHNQWRPNYAVQVDPAHAVRAVGRIAPAEGSPAAVRRSAEQQPPRPPPAVRQAQPEVRAEPPAAAPRQPGTAARQPALQHALGVPVDQIRLTWQEAIRRAINAYRYQQASLDRPTLRMRHPSQHVPLLPGAFETYNEARNQTRRQAFELPEQERVVLLAEGRRVREEFIIIRLYSSKQLFLRFDFFFGFCFKRAAIFSNSTYK